MSDIVRKIYDNEAPSEKRKQLRNRDESNNIADLSNPRVDLTGKYCKHPFIMAEINCRGLVNLCCPTWVSKPIGNIFEDTLENIFHSDIAKEYRQSVIDGSFKYCNHQLCPKIQAGLGDIDMSAPEISNPRIEYVNLAYDDSCNLQCPSCRCVRICHTEGPVYEARLKIHQKVVDYIDNCTHPLKINITGSGDPFGSKIFREFLFSYDGTKKPNLIVDLQTNGVMLTEKTWEKMSKLHSNLNAIIVSIDANSEEVYKYTRRGGSWSRLSSNLDYIRHLRTIEKINFVRLDFVVQNRNYHEIPSFARRIYQEGIDSIYFSIISDWGTYTVDDFNTQAVWKTSHPNHGHFLRILRECRMDLMASGVDTGNLTHFIKS